MADEEKPKKKWSLWGEKKPKPKPRKESIRDQMIQHQMDRDQALLSQQLRAARQMRPDTPMWSSTQTARRQQEQLDALLGSMTSRRRNITEHNPMDAMCRENYGRQSASSARCTVCRPPSPRPR